MRKEKNIDRGVRGRLVYQSDEQVEIRLKKREELK